MALFKGADLPFGALLVLVATTLPSARVDLVTWEQCKSTDVLSSRAQKARSIKPFKWDSKATSLYLAYCNLPHINHSISSLPKVSSIDLSNNNLQFINLEVFTPVSSLNELDLSFNRLSTVPVFGQHALFPNMTELSLNSNRISFLLNLKTFGSMQQLQKLHLNDNQLRNIDVDVFKPLVSLRVLNLSSNKISYVPNEMFQVSSLETVRLNDNVIQFVGASAFGDRLKSLALSANRLSYLPNDFFLKLGSGARLENLALASNPWQCECLLEILSDAKNLGICDDYNLLRPRVHFFVQIPKLTLNFN